MKERIKSAFDDALYILSNVFIVAAYLVLFMAMTLVPLAIAFEVLPSYHAWSSLIAWLAYVMVTTPHRLEP